MSLSTIQPWREVAQQATNAAKPHQDFAVVYELNLISGLFDYCHHLLFEIEVSYLFVATCGTSIGLLAK